MSDYCPEHDSLPERDKREKKALDGLTIVDAGNLIADPFATALLADFGANVIKIEHPGFGDDVRGLKPEKNGESLLWKELSRNKQCVTLDLSTEKGSEVFKDLVAEADVVTENYRPGTMERWGIGYEDLQEVNEEIIMLRISGFGQTGPYRKRPGFGRIAGAFSTMTSLIGESDGPPMTPGFPAGDTVSGIFGALSIMIAVYHRDVNDGSGQMIDLGLYESLFRMLEFSAIAYDQNEDVMLRNGNTHTYVAPSSTYETEDDEYISFTASTESVWQRLTEAIGRPELDEDPRFKNHKVRVDNSEEINSIVRDWVSRHTSDEIDEIFNEHGIPFSFAYDIQDAFQDEHYRERESLVRVPDEELGEMVVQNAIPKMSETPGGIDHLGPQQGAHNEEVYGEILGYDDDMLSELRTEEVI